MSTVNLNLPLKTNRLLLREFVPSDFADMFVFESDPEVVKYVCYGPYTEEECRRDLGYHIENQTANPRIYYHLAIVLPEENKLIGWCGLERISEKDRELEIGYALNRHYWGKGYATEAAEAMLQFGFKELNAHRIFATANPANKGSHRVLEKLGLQYEGCLRQQKWCRDNWRDVVVFAILDHEFRVPG